MYFVTDRSNKDFYTRASYGSMLPVKELVGFGL